MLRGEVNLPPGEAGVLLHLAAAWVAGGLIGLERSYNGRAAGFRTHALVALAAAAVIALAMQPTLIPGSFPKDGPRLDPSRLAQGVMTGVGFLGAGVIFKEGVSVQGLTTAACVWTTAALGLLFGAGLVVPACAVTVGVLFTLFVLRRLETLVPEKVFAVATFRFHTAHAPDPVGLRDLIGPQDTELDDLSFALADGGAIIEYRANLKVGPRRSLEEIALRLRAHEGLAEFDIARISR